MARLNVFRGVQICDRTGHLQDAVVRSRRKTNRVMAFSSNFSPSGVIAQYLRIILGIICALEYVFLSAR